VCTGEVMKVRVSSQRPRNETSAFSDFPIKGKMYGSKAEEVKSMPRSLLVVKLFLAGKASPEALLATAIHFDLKMQHAPPQI